MGSEASGVAESGMCGSGVSMNVGLGMGVNLPRQTQSKSLEVLQCTCANVCSASENVRERENKGSNDMDIWCVVKGGERTCTVPATPELIGSFAAHDPSGPQPCSDKEKYGASVASMAHRDKYAQA